MIYISAQQEGEKMNLNFARWIFILHCRDEFVYCICEKGVYIFQWGLTFSKAEFTLCKAEFTLCKEEFTFFKAEFTL